MATYAMKCRACGHSYEVDRPMSKGPPKRCPKCKADEKKGFSQDWSSKKVIGWTYGEDHITTVGQQMELNTKRTSAEERQAMLGGLKPKTESIWSKLPGAVPVDTSESETPFWRDGSINGLQKLDKPLDLKQVASADKYIQTGATT